MSKVIQIILVPDSEMSQGSFMVLDSDGRIWDREQVWAMKKMPDAVGGREQMCNDGWKWVEIVGPLAPTDSTENEERAAIDAILT